MIISDPRHTECSNLTKARWAQYTCNHENNVPSWLSPQWVCGNSCTWAHDVRLHIASTNEPKSAQHAKQGAYKQGAYTWITYDYLLYAPCLGLIGRDGGLSTLCHICGFACQ